MLIRLNKFLSQSGLASRRKADELIESGEVMVNGKRVFELGVRIDPAKDHVKVNGKKVELSKDSGKYILFHKPKGVITSLEDPAGRSCVGDFFKKYSHRVFPIGRLDYDSEGMLLLTNDGDFANKVSHPSSDILKKYLVKVEGKVETKHIEKLKKGVSIPEGGKVRARTIKKLKTKSTEKNDWLVIEIAEGKNRQIRKMFEKVGFDVIKLQRTAIGGLEMGKLPRGEFKELTLRQLQKIFEKPQDKKVKERQKSKKILPTK